MAWVVPVVMAAVSAYSSIKGSKEKSREAKAARKSALEGIGKGKAWMTERLSPLAIKERADSLGFYGLTPNVPYDKFTSKQKKAFRHQSAARTASTDPAFSPRAQKLAHQDLAASGGSMLDVQAQHPLPDVQGPQNVSAMPGGTPDARLHGGAGGYYHGGVGNQGAETPQIPTQIGAAPAPTPITSSPGGVTAGDPGVVPGTAGTPASTPTPSVMGGPATPPKAPFTPKSTRKSRRRARKAATQAGFEKDVSSLTSSPPGSTPGEFLMAHMMDYLKNPGRLSSTTYERAQEQSNINQTIGNTMLAGEAAGAGVDPRSPAAQAISGGLALNAMKGRNEAARDYSLASENLRREDVANALSMFQAMLGDATGLQSGQASLAPAILNAGANAPSGYGTSSGTQIAQGLASIDWGSLISSLGSKGATSVAPNTPGTQPIGGTR